ncbi:MAG: hypothetical protein ACLP8A_00805 [Methylovirgula sp.]
MTKSERDSCTRRDPKKVSPRTKFFFQAGGTIKIDVCPVKVWPYSSNTLRLRPLSANLALVGNAFAECVRRGRWPRWRFLMIF